MFENINSTNWLGLCEATISVDMPDRKSIPEFQAMLESFTNMGFAS